MLGTVFFARFDAGDPLGGFVAVLVAVIALAVLTAVLAAVLPRRARAEAV